MKLFGFIGKFINGFRQNFLQTELEGAAQSSSVAKSTLESGKPQSLKSSIISDFKLVRGIAKDLMDIGDCEFDNSSTKKWIIEQRIEAIKNGDILATESLSRKQVFDLFKKAIDSENGDASKVRDIFSLSAGDRGFIGKANFSLDSHGLSDYEVDHVDMDPKDFMELLDKVGTSKGASSDRPPADDGVWLRGQNFDKHTNPSSPEV